MDAQEPVPFEEIEQRLASAVAAEGGIDAKDGIDAEIEAAAAAPATDAQGQDVSSNDATADSFKPANDAIYIPEDKTEITDGVADQQEAEMLAALQSQVAGGARRGKKGGAKIEGGGAEIAAIIGAGVVLVPLAIGVAIGGILTLIIGGAVIRFVLAIINKLTRTVRDFDGSTLKAMMSVPLKAFGKAAPAADAAVAPAAGGKPRRRVKKGGFFGQTQKETSVGDIVSSLISKACMHPEEVTNILTRQSTGYYGNNGNDGNDGNDGSDGNNNGYGNDGNNDDSNEFDVGASYNRLREITRIRSGPRAFCSLALGSRHGPLAMITKNPVKEAIKHLAEMFLGLKKGTFGGGKGKGKGKSSSNQKGGVAEALNGDLANVADAFGAVSDTLLHPDANALAAEHAATDTKIFGSFDLFDTCRNIYVRFEDDLHVRMELLKVNMGDIVNNEPPEAYVPEFNKLLKVMYKIYANMNNIRAKGRAPAADEKPTKCMSKGFLSYGWAIRRQLLRFDKVVGKYTAYKRRLLGMEGGKRRVASDVRKVAPGTAKVAPPVKTAERIAIKGKTRIVYRGSRGAAYVRMNGKMVAVRLLQSAR